jgi:predicted nicotinamide N-methyase
MISFSPYSGDARAGKSLSPRFQRRLSMSRYITTRTVLAVTTLSGLVAIALAVTSHHSGVNAIEATPKALTNSAVESTANAGSAPLSQVQLAVLLEGFDWQVPLGAIRSASVL